ncbi:type VI secretion system lipoprotein TssJ [Burkholderia sp. L27(2015)]|uniref:type VI secretion system lipoprotein TssJ n=1 Tax=Burkholderia sp. L27(2015) TaxID=1641858 RepID=UPI0020B127E6|nr:type VI secretion system lipoprotein TssJ [Burkholderia sp. L27(2015)]
MITVALSGCGVGQAVQSSTVAAAKWAFTTQVKTMNLDLVSRASLNANGTGQPLSTVVRIYQLKKSQAFEKLAYTQLQANDLGALKADILTTKDIVLRPDSTASISVEMNAAAEYIGIAAFFRSGGKDATWKLVVPKKQWKRTDPVKIEVQGNTLQRSS